MRPQRGLNPRPACCFQGLFSGGGDVSLRRRTRNPWPSLSPGRCQGPKCLRPRPRWRPLYAAGCRRGRTPNAITRMIRVTGMVQRITQAPPPRLTNPQATTGLPFPYASVLLLFWPARARALFPSHQWSLTCPRSCPCLWQRPFSPWLLATVSAGQRLRGLEVWSAWAGQAAILVAPAPALRS